MIFVFYFLIVMLWLSLFSCGMCWCLSEFVGIENYIDFFVDLMFWKVVFNNFIYVGVIILILIVIVLVMVFWVNFKILVCGFICMVYFILIVLFMIVVVNFWFFFYILGFGVLDQIGSLFGLLSINWLGQLEIVLWVVIIVMIWKEVGFFMIFYFVVF